MLKKQKFIKHLWTNMEFNSKYELVKAEVKHDINYSEFTKAEYLTFKKKLESFSFHH